MKKIIIGILVVFFCVGCLAGCSTQQNSDTENIGTVLTEASSPLVGCWVYEDGNNKSVMQFFSNGMVVTATTHYSSYSWTKTCKGYFTEDDFLCMYEEDDSAPQTAQFSINGNELTISSVSSVTSWYDANSIVNNTFVKYENDIEDYLLAQINQMAVPTETPAPTATSTTTATRAPNANMESDATPTPTPIVYYNPNDAGGIFG